MRIPVATIDPRNESVEVPVRSVDAPPPGEESVGPTMYDFVVELRRSQEVSHFLMEQATNLLKRRSIVEKSFGNTSAAGLLQLPIYQVPNGYQFYLTRWNVEAVGYSPGAPYINAVGQISIFNGVEFGDGAMVDFLPNPPAANGAILPASSTDGLPSAPLFRGGETVSLRLVAGPATTKISVRIQGVQEVI